MPTDSSPDSRETGETGDTGPETGETDTGDPPVPVDGDGDGYYALATGGDDCDDQDPRTHPGGAEVCDYADRDCDGDPYAPGVCASAPVPEDAAWATWLGTPWSETTTPTSWSATCTCFQGGRSPGTRSGGGGSTVDGRRAPTTRRCSPYVGPQPRPHWLATIHSRREGGRHPRPRPAAGRQGGDLTRASRRRVVSWRWWLPWTPPPPHRNATANCYPTAPLASRLACTRYQKIHLEGGRGGRIRTDDLLRPRRAVKYVAGVESRSQIRWRPLETAGDRWRPLPLLPTLPRRAAQGCARASALAYRRGR